MRTSSGTSCAGEPDGSARSAVTKIKMPWSRKLRTSPHQVLQSMHILIRVVFPEEGQMTRRKVFGAAFVALLAVLGFTQAMLDRQALSQGETVQAPIFEVDPLWPKPLPNHWLLGASIGVWVDEQDVVWMIHRSSATLNNNEKGAEISPPTGECCRGAPQVLAFDQAGNLVRHWGGTGAGYEWPEGNHGVFVDHKGNVWIGGHGAKDSRLLKVTKGGKFLMQAGPHAQQQSTNDPENFGR